MGVAYNNQSVMLGPVQLVQSSGTHSMQVKNGSVQTSTVAAINQPSMIQGSITGVVQGSWAGASASGTQSAIHGPVRPVQSSGTHSIQVNDGSVQTSTAAEIDKQSFMQGNIMSVEQGTGGATEYVQQPT